MLRRYGFGFNPFVRNTDEIRFLRSQNFTGKTVYDVGSYVGMHTLFFSQTAKEVVAFEPCWKSLTELCMNVSLNELSNVKICACGLSDYAGMINMKFNYGRTRTGRGKAETQVCSLDDLDLPDPDFIKMDIEGDEVKALLGMTKTIGRCRPELFIELHGTRKSVLMLLEQYGYEIQDIGESHIYAT
jgi:FkbM family methyltransferase